MLPPSEPAGYRQIAADLRERIRSGILSPGQRIMSAKDLAQSYGVAIHTAEGAIRLLKVEGLIVSERGRRSRVAEQPDVERVPFPAHAEVSVRMPTPDEARELKIGEGVPIFEVVGIDEHGAPMRIRYAGDRTRLFRR